MTPGAQTLSLQQAALHFANGALVAARHPLPRRINRMSILSEFKDFINRGSVVDLAVGVVIGAAFSKVVTSLVDDLLMPPIGKILGNLDFSNLYFSLSDKTPPAGSLAEIRKLGLPVIAWGNFLTVVINFLIVALCIFLVVKAVNALKKKQAVQPSPEPKDVVLLREIRDLLKTGPTPRFPEGGAQ
ncbi:MAG: mscL [Chthoniobacteraceae bacterium]|nr:mscL [Chthoniobacteraceae bacterium]